MSHNIATAGIASGYLPTTEHDGNGTREDREAVPCVGSGIWRNPVLTVVNDHEDNRRASFLFLGQSGLVVDPWGKPVNVTGEDLYAFRELLNELPESAFKRPADSVPDAWIDGDTVRYDSNTSDLWTVRVRQGGAWVIVASSDGGLISREQGMRDAYINGCLRRRDQSWTVVRRGGKLVTA